MVAVAVALASPVGGDLVGQDYPFGCYEGPVGVDIDRSPRLHFKRLKALPDLSATLTAKYPFRFAKDKLQSAVVYLTSKGPEGGVWHRETNVDFEIYAETVRRGGAGGRAPNSREYWRLVEPPMQTRSVYEPGVKLLFNGRNGGMADISVSSAGSPQLPVLHISYGQDLGGANADNWNWNHLLVDFRSAEPRVLATAECGYNEGGGACTAIDSSQMARFDLRCPWRPASGDFLCTEVTGSAHRDFHLLNPDLPPPPRPGEVATMADAIVRLRGRPHRGAVVVRGVGPVRLVRDVELPAGLHVLILGSPGRFHAVPESGGQFGPPLSVEPRDLSAVLSPATENPPKDALDSNSWTLEGTASFSSFPLHHSDTLFLLRVVAHGIHAARSLSWVGIEDRGATQVLDALTLASESENYEDCGHYSMAPAVVAVHAITRPFRALVDVQPAVSSGGEDTNGLVWGTEGQYAGQSPVLDCLRRGEISWISGKGFRVVVRAAPCGEGQATKPRYVRVNASGKVTLSEEPSPSQEAP